MCLYNFNKYFNIIFFNNAFPLSNTALFEHDPFKHMLEDFTKSSLHKFAIFYALQLKLNHFRYIK